MKNEPSGNLTTSSSFSLHPSSFICSLVIVIAVLLLGGPGLTEGGLGWSDAPNHTFDGIFVLECVKQMPFDHPRAWAEQFYIQHPSLGIFVYWPPGFAIVEAVMFALLGVTIAAARMTVLVFAVGAGFLMYSLGRRWFDRPTGLFAALLLITCPHGVLWLNDVMLEWPATFWILAAVYAYQKDRDAIRLVPSILWHGPLARDDTPARRRCHSLGLRFKTTLWSIALAIAISGAFFTKQTAGFILPVILLHALLSRDRWRYLRRPAFVVSMVVSVGLIAAYTMSTRQFTALPAQLLAPSLDLSEIGHWLPEILGWPLLPVALLGLGTLILTPDRAARGLLLIWFGAWTVFCLLIAAKEPRYLFFSIPPLAFAAARFFIWPPAPEPSAQRAGSSPSAVERNRPSYRGVRSTTDRQSSDAPRIAFLTALVIVQAALAHTKSTGRLPDYAAAVAELASRPDADLVLVDAVRDGQFVFDVYQNPDARNKIIPLRASKLLYARAARMKYSGQTFVETDQDIVDLLDQYAIRYIVIESALPKTHYIDADPPPRKLLRNLLATDSRFTLVEAWSLRCDDPIWDDVELRLYAYPDCPPRNSKTVTLSFPAMGREVTFQLP